MSDNWNKFLESLLLVWIKRSTGVGCSSHIIFSDKFLKAWYSWAFFNPEGSLKAKEFTHGSMNEMSCISAGVEISFAVVSDWHGVNSLPVGILVYFVIPPQNRILVRSMNYSSVQCFKGTWCHLQCKSTKVLAIINRTQIKRVGSLTFSVLDCRLREVWLWNLARSLCYVLGQNTLLSSGLSLSRGINGYR